MFFLAEVDRCVCRFFVFFFSSRRRHTRWTGDWSSDVCSSDLVFGGWVMAGVVWGVVWPLLAGTFTLPSAVRAGIGITAVGGVVTATIVFFSIENRWRHELPQLFPAGDLSSVRGVPRLPVRARLLVVFLLTSVGPLALLGLVAWRRGRLAAADPANAGMMLGEML